MSRVIAHQEIADELIYLRRRLETLERENDTLRSEREALLNSTSWRLTQPLRRTLQHHPGLAKNLAGFVRRILRLRSRFAPSPLIPYNAVPVVDGIKSGTGKFILLDIDWEHTARPCDISNSEDSRHLAAALSMIVIRDAATSAPLQVINFNRSGNSKQYVCYGVSTAEEWGAWSVGARTSLIVHLPDDCGDKVEVIIYGAAYHEAFASVKGRATANFKPAGSFELTNGIEQAVISLNIADFASFDVDSHNLSNSDANPEISIVILDFNKPGITLASILAALNSKTERKFEIIVLENGSAYENVRILRNMNAPIRIVSLNANRYFGEGNNIAAEKARGKKLLFLNNDAFLSDFVLDRLASVLDNDAKIGAVGPIFLYPDGSIQEAGAFVRPDGSAYQRGKKEENFQRDSVPRIDIVDYVSAACIMLRREDFFELGGFDLKFDPAYYEDTDLCLRLAAIGKSVALCADAQVTHIENATTSDPENQKITANVVERHKSIFMSRWRAWLETRKAENLPIVLRTRSEAVEDAIAARSNQEEINAVYTPFPLSLGGGERYILGAALALRESRATAVVTPDPYSTLRLNTLLGELGYPSGSLFTLDDVQIADRTVDTGVLMGNELLPVRTISASKRIYHCQFPFPEQLTTAEMSRRKKALADYHAVVVNSDFTKKAWAERLDALGVSAPPIHVIHPPVSISGLSDEETKPKENLVLCVGRFHPDGHSKRQDIVIEGFLAATRADPTLAGWKLVLAGSVPTEKAAVDYYDKLRRGSPENVEFVLSAPREQMISLMARASLIVSATGFGVRDSKDDHKCEHFGIAVVEAASYGCIPVVYGRGGPAELLPSLGVGVEFMTTAELADKIVEAVSLATEPKNRATLRRNSQNFSERAFLSSWRELLNNIDASASKQHC